MNFFIPLLLAVAGAAIANRTIFPQPVVWCLLGFVAAFIPGFPAFHFDPQVALLFVLPPLVYASAVELPWPEFRDNLRPIGILAIGLVLATAAIAAGIAHYSAGLTWASAAVLGAVISPTDPIAASSVAAQVGIPRRLIAILEGEGLVNDAVALTLFRLALAAAVTGNFSITSGLTRFTAIAIGEPLYGWLLGIVIARMRAKISDARLEIAVSLLTPFAAYLVPEHLGGSGILATVATGMYIGERRATLVPAGTRLRAISFWSMAVFLLNGLLFVIAGMELRQVLGSSFRPFGASLGLAIAGVVVATRLVGCFVTWFLLRLLRPIAGSERNPMPARHLAIVASAGIRGPISLAAAMAIPAFSGAESFGAYGSVLSVTAVVIFATLLLQGSVLPVLVRALRVSADARAEDRTTEDEEVLASEEAVRAALECLNKLEEEQRVSPAVAQGVRCYYENIHRFHGNAHSETTGTESARAVLSELLEVERARILSLRNRGRIGDQALTRLQRTLDLRRALLD